MTTDATKLAETMAEFRQAIYDTQRAQVDELRAIRRELTFVKETLLVLTAAVIGRLVYLWWHG